MRLPYSRADVLRGVLVYASGDTAAALLQGQFSPVRTLGMMLVGGAVYALENALDTWPRMEKADRVHFWVGLCYERSGNAAMAVQWYEAFLAKYPNHMWADQARRKVAQLRAEHT